MDQLKRGGVLDDEPPSVCLIATNGAEPPTPMGKDEPAPLVIEAVASS